MLLIAKLLALDSAKDRNAAYLQDPQHRENRRLQFISIGHKTKQKYRKVGKRLVGKEAGLGRVCRGAVGEVLQRCCKKSLQRCCEEGIYRGAVGEGLQRCC